MHNFYVVVSCMSNYTFHKITQLYQEFDCPDKPSHSDRLLLLVIEFMVVKEIYMFLHDILYFN